MSITTLVKSIQDIMRQDAGVDGDAQRISQLVWMLFLKIFEHNDVSASSTSPTSRPSRRAARCIVLQFWASLEANYHG